MGGEIFVQKKNYDKAGVTAVDIRRTVKERREERNRKVKALMKHAKESDLPAGLIMRSVQDGAVSSDLLAVNTPKLELWKNARNPPQELDIPYSTIFLFMFSVVMVAAVLIIRRGRKKAAV